MNSFFCLPAKSLLGSEDPITRYESMSVTTQLQIDSYQVDKPARLIIRMLFGFASDSVFDKVNQSTNNEKTT